MRRRASNSAPRIRRRGGGCGEKIDEGPGVPRSPRRPAARRLPSPPLYAIRQPAAAGGRRDDNRRDQAMTIKVGDKMPSATLRYLSPEGPKEITTDELFRGKKVALFAVPGAFTPACSQRHLPGFVDKAAELKAKGIDQIACVAVNDAFVMNAWGKSQNVDDKVMMLADGSGDFAKAVGLTLDMSARGLGVRSQRYSMLVDNGVVKSLNVEAQPGSVEASSAEAMLKAL
jgi:glutaredoxin/glutathione-dependent peroxiredoxin